MTGADGLLEVSRARMFRASSRYWLLRSPGPEAVLWWSPLEGAPEGGAAWIHVRTTAANGPGAPAFQAVEPDVVTPLGGDGEDVLVLASHLRAGAAGVHIGLCAGSRDQVEDCRAEITGGAEEPPAGCGCSTTSGAAASLLFGTALLAVLRARRRVLGGLWAAALLAVAPAAASAQEADGGTPVVPTPPELTTVVTGTRAPQRVQDSTVATEVITRRQIQESGARDVAEVLQSRPGLELFQNVGATALRMQGLGPEYSLVLIDGQRPTGRLNGGLDISRLPVEDIEQIEIVKGPSSVLWGSDALAGTVNIITRRARKPLGGTATGSFGLLTQADVQATGEATSGPWSVAASGGYRHRDAYDHAPQSAATSGSSLDQGQGSARGTFGGGDASRISGDVRVDFTRRVQHGVDQSGVGAVIDRRSRDNILEGRAAARIPAGRGALGASLGVSIYDRRFILDQRGSSALDDVQDSRDDNVQLGLQLDQALGETHQAMAGGEVLLERLVSPRLETGTGQRLRGALFLQDAWTPRLERPLSLVGGVRLDADSTFGAAVTPRLAARFDPAPELVLRASTGLGYRAPSFQEQLLDFENPSAGYVVVGNPGLRPERSFGSTAGAEWRPSEAWLLSLGLFWNELWDMIGFEAISSGELLRFRYVNLARVRSRGLEASVSWATPLRGLSVEAGYTLTDARDLTAGLPLDGQSPHRWLSQARYRHREWGLTATARASVTGPRPFNVDEQTTQWSAPFVMLDARVAKALGDHLELFVAGANLAGAGNAADNPIPPRSVFAGVTLHD